MSSDGALTWGVGPSVTLPSASNPEVLGSGKVSLGPSGVFFLGLGKWAVGAVASNSWSVAGNGDREDVNFFFSSFNDSQNSAVMGVGCWSAIATSRDQSSL